MFSLRITGRFMSISDSFLAAASSQKGCSCSVYPGMIASMTYICLAQASCPLFCAGCLWQVSSALQDLISKHCQGSWCPFYVAGIVF